MGDLGTGSQMTFGSLSVPSICKHEFLHLCFETKLSNVKNQQ